MEVFSKYGVVFWSWYQEAILVIVSFLSSYIEQETTEETFDAVFVVASLAWPGTL